MKLTYLADVAVGPLGATKTTPSKVVEALALETPIIVGTGSVGHELEILSSGLRVVDPTADALANALHRALQAGRAGLAEDLDARMRGFDWATIVLQLEQELERLVAARTVATKSGRGG